MDRGSPALKAHFSNLELLEMRQTRRGWCQECLGCEARTEFKYFANGNQIAHSLANASFLMRLCFPQCYPFQTVVKELNTDAEIISTERPFRCGVGACKCCCYQEMSIKSGGEDLGKIEETCYYCCVPEFHVSDHTGRAIYKIHPPSCCGGMCINCCAEGNPCCGKGCCKVPFHVFPGDMKDTNGAEEIGKILKKPKSVMTEILTDAVAMDVTFPQGATPAEKGLLTGSALFLNANYFEGDDN